MKPPSQGEDSVGYRRPPRAHRWKKGQSGNPRRRYPEQPLSPVEMIDRLLLEKIEITENGVTRLATKLEAILLRLWRKELDGDLKALDLRLRFQNIATQYADEGIRVIFADSEYTRALSTGLKPKGSNDD
jgi:hypothetical protein